MTLCFLPSPLLSGLQMLREKPQPLDRLPSFLMPFNRKNNAANAGVLRNCWCILSGRERERERRAR